MAEVDIQWGIQENTVGVVERFAEIATADPVSAALLVAGALLVFFSMTVFGVLSLGAAGAWFKGLLPTAGGRPPRAR